MKLTYHERFDKVQSMTKSRQDNYVTNRIGAVYTKIETKLSGPIRQDVTYHKNQTEQLCDRL